MLDIKLLRDQPEQVINRVSQRGGSAHELVTQVLSLDEERRARETEKQRLQSERNRISKEIGIAKKSGQDSSEQEAASRALGDKLVDLENAATEAEQQQRDLLLQIPNLPHPACPVGKEATDNPVVRIHGSKPTFDFQPKGHQELGAQLNMLDFQGAGTISGSGFVVFRGAGARLERSLINFLLDRQSLRHGYQEVSTPYLIKRDCMIGTGQLPKFEEDMYGLEDGAMFLAPTAEVPVTNLLREQILNLDQLPIKMAAYSPCFRREAGSAGRESRGLIRMHQFDKIELVQVVHPEQSYRALEELTGHAEAVLQELGIHYRVIELCTGDLGFSSAKTYDIEVWAPGQDGWLEVSSCSNFEDYQARRMQLRFKDENGKNRFCHTLNGSGTALPRLMVAVLETHQQADGTIKLPPALHSYFGSEIISSGL